MIFFLLIFSLIMTIYLYKVSKRALRPIFQTAIRIYTFLFSLTVIFTIMAIIVNHKETILHWVQEQQQEAYAYADTNTNQQVIPTNTQVPIEVPIQPSKQLNVPIIKQYPELPRGCEVTSLAMLLNYYDIHVSKMKLAKEVIKDNTKFTRTEKGIYFGNPTKGFVGDMYSLSTPGYGVYHQPIAILAEKYLGEKVNDFSGGTFFEILQHINQGRPVWVIINSTYKVLPESQFETWQTDDGPIQITMKEHSVLITGYDKDYIYFNDPLSDHVKKAPIDEFKGAWIQMGRQAITVKP